MPRGEEGIKPAPARIPPEIKKLEKEGGNYGKERGVSLMASHEGKIRKGNQRKGHRRPDGKEKH